MLPSRNTDINLSDSLVAYCAGMMRPIETSENHNYFTGFKLIALKLCC